MRIAPGTPSSEEAMRALTEALPRLRAIAKTEGVKRPARPRKKRSPRSKAASDG